MKDIERQILNSSEVSDFFMLRCKGLGTCGLVSHISLTGFKALVSYTSDPFQAILFTYDQALAFSSKLESHDSNSRGYDIVPFHS